MDNLTKRGQPDRSKINMHEAYEVKYWTHALGVSKEDLQKAVDKVGNLPPSARSWRGNAPNACVPTRVPLLDADEHAPGGGQRGAGEDDHRVVAERAAIAAHVRAELAELVMARGIEQSRQPQQCGGDVIHRRRSPACPCALAKGVCQHGGGEIFIPPNPLRCIRIKFEASGGRVNRVPTRGPRRATH